MHAAPFLPLSLPVPLRLLLRRCLATPVSEHPAVSQPPPVMIKKSTQLLGVGALALSALLGSARAADTVKVGVLHSLSGTMAISETSLRDVLLFAFDEINAKG